MKRASLFLGTGLWLLWTSAIAQPTVLNVPTVIQEQNQWCWAAVSASVIRASGTYIDQCTIAEYTRVRATWHNFGEIDCCVDASQGCNYWNYNWGYDGSIRDILSYWGVENYGTAAALSLSTVEQEILAMRPFIIRWGWTSGGGHFLVGYGIDGSLVYYMNPWPGEGAKIAEYEWVTSGDDHTWTHTNVLTTPLAVQLASFTATWAGTAGVRLEWMTVSECNNYGFEVERKDNAAGNFQCLRGGFVAGHGTTVTPQKYTFIDEDPLPNGGWYRLRQIDLDGSSHYSEAITPSQVTAVQHAAEPVTFVLQQNFPNPFNPTTKIRYQVPVASAVRLEVYDLLGQEVAMLQEGHVEAGVHDIRFDGSGLPGGVYIYRLHAGSFTDAKRLILLK
jgi:hypothetical protein